MADEKEKLTTAAGIPVADNQNSLTAGERGPLHLIAKPRTSRSASAAPLSPATVENRRKHASAGRWKIRA